MAIKTPVFFMQALVYRDGREKRPRHPMMPNSSKRPVPPRISNKQIVPIVWVIGLSEPIAQLMG